LPKRTEYSTYREKGKKMELLTVSDARKNLYKLIDDVAKTHEPAMIKGKRNSAVILSQEDWENIQETIYLLSIPQMKESIIEADKEADEECAKEINW